MMKISFLALLLMGLAALPSFADPLAGKWQIHSNIAGNESDLTCDLTQKDADLSGTCKSEQQTVTITGKVDGKKVTWSYKSEYNGSPLTVNYEGKLESDTKIVGTVTVPEFSVDGDFTATLSK
ncbi:MAG: hypothetical protein WB676_27780 [Bryobacteraceae bacterium]